MAAIAGILFVVAWGLVDWGYMRRVVRTSGGDSAVLVATFVATLTVPLEYAVLVGVALNIALYMRRATQLHMQEMVPTSAGPFLEQPLTAKSGERAVTFLQIEGSLFFAQADEFEERLSSLLRGPVRVVIFRLKRVHSIDATILTVLDGFARSMSHEDRHIVLCGIRPDLMKDLKEFGLVRLLGNENIFETDFGVFASAEAALERAKQLLGESIDVDAIDTESE
jgi:SulP family sulfate permease